MPAKSVPPRAALPPSSRCTAALSGPQSRDPWLRDYSSVLTSRPPARGRAGASDPALHGPTRSQHGLKVTPKTVGTFNYFLNEKILLSKEIIGRTPTYKTLHSLSHLRLLRGVTCVLRQPDNNTGSRGATLGCNACAILLAECALCLLRCKMSAGLGFLPWERLTGLLQLNETLCVRPLAQRPATSRPSINVGQHSFKTRGRKNTAGFCMN